MKKRQFRWAIVFGAMLAITGCGSDSGSGASAGSGGSDGSGGSAGSGGMAGTGGVTGTGGSSGGNDAATVCSVICDNCTDSVAECQSACERGLEDTTDVDLEACPSELGALQDCLDDANTCLSFIADCGTQYTTWIACVFGGPI